MGAAGGAAAGAGAGAGVRAGAGAGAGAGGGVATTVGGGEVESSGASIAATAMAFNVLSGVASARLSILLLAIQVTIKLHMCTPGGILR